MDEKFKEAERAKLRIQNDLREINSSTYLDSMSRVKISDVYHFVREEKFCIFANIESSQGSSFFYGKKGMYFTIILDYNFPYSFPLIHHYLYNSPDFISNITDTKGFVNLEFSQKSDWNPTITIHKLISMLSIFIINNYVANSNNPKSLKISDFNTSTSPLNNNKVELKLHDTEIKTAIKMDIDIDDNTNESNYPFKSNLSTSKDSLIAETNKKQYNDNSNNNNSCKINKFQVKDVDYFKKCCLVTDFLEKIKNLVQGINYNYLNHKQNESRKFIEIISVDVNRFVDFNSIFYHESFKYNPTNLSKILENKYPFLNNHSIYNFNQSSSKESTLEDEDVRKAIEELLSKPNKNKRLLSEFNQMSIEGRSSKNELSQKVDSMNITINQSPSNDIKIGSNKKPESITSLNSNKPKTKYLDADTSETTAYLKLDHSFQTNKVMSLVKN